MQQRLVEKEKAAKEEHLRSLAQRAREERGGIAAPKPAASAVEASGSGSGGAGLKSSLAAYGSDEESGSEEEGSDAGEEEDEEARKVRDEMRSEKRREREREMRMNNMGTEQRAKMLARCVFSPLWALKPCWLTCSFSYRQENRDISEKIALGLAKPTLTKESMLDSRLFNRESLSSSFAGEDSYNLYDRPLFHGSTAASAIYKARSGNLAADGSDLGASGSGQGGDKFGGGTEEGITAAMTNDRFSLGASKFAGASEQEIREGPVVFEKDVSIAISGDGDVFGVDKFLDEAKRGTKRGLDLAA